MRIGKSLKLPDSQVEAFSKISAIDIEASRAYWSSTVPARYKPLLQSQTVGADRDLSTPFVWDGVNRRYIDRRSRRYVPYSEIRARAIEPMINASKASLRALGASLQQGGALSDWQIGVMQEVKLSQVAAGLAANGGPDKMTEEDKRKIEEELLLLLLLLRGFAFDLESGKTPLNGRLLLRSDLYAAAARETFEEIRRYGMGAYFGAVQERRILGKAEHCRTDEELEGCVELADRGWSPINSLPRLGRTPCRTNCKCHFDYRYMDERGVWVVVDDSATVALILRQLRVRESAIS